MATIDNTAEHAGLTQNQFLIWLGQEAHPQSSQFNELTVIVVDGALDRSHFRQATQMVIDHTDSLRTVERRVDGLPTAVVLDELAYDVAFVDLSLEPDPDTALEAWSLHHVEELLDLSLRSFEVTLLKLSEARYAWSHLQHHMFSDGTSMMIVVERLGECYRRLAAGDVDWTPQYPAFADYLTAEREARRSKRHGKRASYWESKTANPSDPVTFYEGRALSSAHGLRTERVMVDLGPERSEAVRRFARQDGIHFISEDLSTFSVFAAAYLAFLFRLSEREQIGIGVTWQNRRRPFRNTVGLLMEQNPFVVPLDPDDTVQALIGKVHHEAMSIMRHLPYPAGNPGGRVYDATLNYVKVAVPDFGGIAATPHWYRPTENSGSLGLQIHDLAGQGNFSLSFDFNAELFPAEYRASATTQFINCLMACIDDHSREIGTICLLSDDDLETMSGGGNATAAEYPCDQTVHELFAAQAARRPRAIAARCDDASLTYEQLNRRATALAARLVTLGVGPGVLVGACVERSLDMLVGVLGILKAGGGYVPLDPAFPAERLAFMLEDSGACVLVTESSLLGTVEPGQREVLCLDLLEDADVTTEPADTSRRATADDLAYVLYTSGSTGKPKGVEITHRALTNFLWAMRSRPGLTEHDVLLAVTTLSFDIAGLELFLPLIVGGRIELATQRQALDGRLLRARLERGDITVMQATPATWRMVVDAGWDGTPGLVALIGGDTLPPDLVQPLLDRTASLWNMYGPTETTIWSSIKHVECGDGDITIGTPIANTTFHVLDRQLQPVPAGVAGELFIGGDGVARGYRNRPELTAEKFVPDPFGAAPGARMYRTGDLVRSRPDGELVHLGRLDQQVKVRGFRIELGEIEAALATHPAVRQCAVTARQDGTRQARVVAYCVTGPDAMPSPADLRTHVRGILPDYMVPHRFVGLDELPLTPNGKIDRKRLSEPSTDDDTPPIAVAHRSPVEAGVSALFAELLEVAHVDRDDDFFERGGDSIHALRLIMGLEREFRCEFPLHVLYEASTVSALSTLVEANMETSPRGLRPETAGGQLIGEPRSRTERRIAGVWEAVLGLATISTDDSFLDLQGSQTLVAPMLERVRNEFGAIAEGISVLDFDADPTIAGLARLLDANIVATSSLVVPLQPKGSAQPIFLIHAGGGYVFFYRALAALLGPDRAVYGVRARTRADSGGKSFDQNASIEEVAASYIEEIRTIQQHGPYALGGASLGGVIAFEMARQLRAAGETIHSPIVLFDSFVAKPENWVPTAEQLGFQGTEMSHLHAPLDPAQGGNTLQKIGLLLRTSLKNPLALWDLVRLVYYSVAWRVRSWRAVRKWYWAYQRVRSQRKSFEEAQLKMMEHFIEVAFHLLTKYEPRPYDGPGVLFRAADSPDAGPGWRPLFEGGLEVHTLPGAHLEMLEEPGVHETAAALRQHLAEHEPSDATGGATHAAQDQP